MTEIPEHLLRRSRERRAALGLGGDTDDGGDAAPAIAAKSESPTAKSAAPAKAAAPAKPAVVEEVAVTTYIAPPPKGPHKTRVPVWIMPVLILLPLWAAFFPSAFSNHHKTAVTDPVALGRAVYQANCSTCHGANGEGGIGPALHGGQSAQTFPNIADQIAWVNNGSMGLKPNTPYGDPARAGGQHKASKNDMPGFSATLSASQIQDVVMFERTAL